MVTLKLANFIMRWFKRKKKPAKQLSDKPTLVRSFTDHATTYAPPYATPRARGSSIAKLPDKVLERIFTFVCPHSQDETYETCEQSSLDDCCPLCDTRDLAHCARVSRKWRNMAVRVLLVYPPVVHEVANQADHNHCVDIIVFGLMQSISANSRKY